MMKLGVNAVMLPELNFDEQLGLCTELGLDYYQYRPRVIPTAERGRPVSFWGNHRFDLTPERLKTEGPELTRRLADAGLKPWGTVPDLTLAAEDSVIRLDLEGAAAAGAPKVRCNPLPYPNQPFDYAALLDKTVARYQHVVDRIARPLGVKLLIETHAVMLASSPGLAWAILRHFDPHEVGLIFDLSNFAREGQVNPPLAVSVLKPWIDSVHVGGQHHLPSGTRDPYGTMGRIREFCAMPESDLHMPTWLKTIRDAALDVPLIIEDYRATPDARQRLPEGVSYLRAIINDL